MPDPSGAPDPRSPLDAFVDAAATRLDASTAAALRDALAAHAQIAGGAKDQTRACLSQTVTAMRAALGNDGAAVVNSSDDAFRALGPLRGQRFSGPQESAGKHLADALELATARLGPIPGGGLGQFMGPDGPPALVPEVKPDQRELVAMAAGAGAALGELAAAGDADAREVLKAVLAAPFV